MGNFTIVNGQVYTPGLAIVDAPQPYTPLGGDTLQVAIDVSGDGNLPWPPSTQSSSSPTLFHSITIFLTSTSQSHNFTISNGTTPSNNNTYVGPVLDLEPSSTVKHVNWVWPECFVGDGSSTDGTARGDYNISMHQAFRWNGTEFYTVFDLPISVTNGISESDERVDCGLLENGILKGGQGDGGVSDGEPWLGANASTTQTSVSATATNLGTGVGVQKFVLVGVVFCLLGQLMG